MNPEIKKHADSGDIKSLKYIFVDSLDVDPTFVRYEEDYNYCKSIPGLLESHIELTPFTKNKSDWDEDYWTHLKMDLIKNFSDKRMSHMREVAQVFLADKMQRIISERSANNSIQNTSVNKTKSIAKYTQKIEPVKQTLITNSKKAEQERMLEEEKRKLEKENMAIDHENKKQTARIEQKRYEYKNTYNTKNKSPKKAIGIAIAAFIVAVILFLILK